MSIDEHNLAEVKKLEFTSLEDVGSKIGSELVTPWFRMDSERTEEFEHSTYLNEYPNPYEDEQGDGYGEGLVEGFHLLGMIDYLLNHVISSASGSRIIPWNYGLDKVRFVSVVRNTDRFRLRGTLVDAQKRETGLRVSLDLVAEVDGREKPAFVATQHALWTPLDSEASAGPGSL